MFPDYFHWYQTGTIDTEYISQIKHLEGSNFKPNYKDIKDIKRKIGLPPQYSI